MTKIIATPKSYSDIATKYCQIVLTEDKTSWHRLVEKADGTIEYRMGAGKWAALTPRQYRTLIRSIVQAAKQHQLTHIALQVALSDFPKLTEMGSEWFLRTLGENLELAQYEFRRYKTKRDEKNELQEILVCGISSPVEKQSF